MDRTAPTIDTQVHLIDPQRYPYPHPPAGYLPKGDEVGTLQSLVGTLNAHGVERAVLVPASIYGSDNGILIDALRHHPNRLRAIATVANESDVHAVACLPGMVGVRLNLVHGRTNQTDATQIARLVADAGLILQLQAAPDLVRKVLGTMDRPDAPVILDHFGRADLAKTARDFDGLLALSRRTNTYLKASAAFRLDHDPIAGVSDRHGQVALIEAFGRKRILWGSDWPFINFAGVKPTYGDTLGSLVSLMGEDWQTAADKNARALFGWPP